MPNGEFQLIKVDATEGVRITAPDEGLSVVLDLHDSESHTREKEITDHPTENGFSISDGTIHKPRILSVHGMITRTPLDPVNVASPNENHLEEALEILETMFQQDYRLNVLTSFRLFIGYYMTVLKYDVQTGDGQSVQVTINFKRVDVVEAETTDIPPRPRSPERRDAAEPEPPGAGAEAGEEAPPPEPEPPPRDRSGAKRAKDAWDDF